MQSVTGDCKCQPQLIIITIDNLVFYFFATKEMGVEYVLIEKLLIYITKLK